MPEPQTVIDMPLDGAAVARFPEMRREAQNGGLRFILLPPGRTAVRFKSEMPFVEVNLASVDYDHAWCSDRIERRLCPADSVGFGPAGGDFYFRVDNLLPSFVMELDVERWSDAVGETCVFDRVEFLPHKHDPVAAELGRAGMALLMEDHRSGERADALALEGIGLGLIARIARRLEDDRSVARGTPTPSALARGRLARVTEWVEANLGESVSVADMAGIAAMSVSHFSRSFKLAMGVGPARYVVIRRVTRAKHLLAHTELSIAEVAYVCGFSGQAHLTRQFRGITGVTPGAFRREAG